MTSNDSSAKPGGSIFAWHEAQAATERCLSSCSRMVFAPRTSGSIAGMVGGGDQAQLQPLPEKVLDEALGPRVFQQSLDLGVKGVAHVQLAGVGQTGQFLIGHRSPEEV